MTSISQAEYQKMIAGKQARISGKYFEDILITSCMMYHDQGMAYIKKTPEPMKPLGRPNEYGQFKACFTERAEPDYQGTLRGGQSIVFEAKHTDKDQIGYNYVTQHQRDALQIHHELGAVALVLVSIQFFDYYRVPWPVWRDMKSLYNRLHMKKVDLAEFKIPIVGGCVMLLDGMEI